MQRVCDELSAGKIDRLLRKWLRRLPHAFPPRDRAAGYLAKPLHDDLKDLLEISGL